MEKRKIRMIGLDLDGTVFNNEKMITEHTREVLAVQPLPRNRV